MSLTTYPIAPIIYAQVSDRCTKCVRCKIISTHDEAHSNSLRNFDQLALVCCCKRLVLNSHVPLRANLYVRLVQRCMKAVPSLRKARGISASSWGGTSVRICHITEDRTDLDLIRHFTSKC